METTITHKDLLDGYETICKDVSTIVSQVRGQEIRWSYRVRHEDGQAVCRPLNADSILLEYDRVGDIEFDPALTDHPANQKITDAVNAVIGDDV